MFFPKYSLSLQSSRSGMKRLAVMKAQHNIDSMYYNNQFTTNNPPCQA